MRARVLLILLPLIAGFGRVSAQTGDVTIKGEVVDIVSYMTTGSRPDSPNGLEIARANAQAGNPLGILEEGTGKLFVVTMKQANTSANSTLIPWLGARIAAVGKVYTRGGTRVLVMTTVGKRAN